VAMVLSTYCHRRTSGDTMSLVPLTDLIMTVLQTHMSVSILAGCEKKTEMFAGRREALGCTRTAGV
jgi:hypothetical protein